MTSDQHAPRPFEDLPDSGLLWLINRQVFHPRGFALALVIDDDGAAAGWKILGDGTEPWQFDPAGERAHLEAVNRTLRGGRR